MEPVEPEDRATSAQQVAASVESKAQAYWKRNLTIIGWLLAVWALVSFGFGILMAAVPLGTIGVLPFSFWWAQQGSIYVFLVLILVYAILMDRAEQHQHHPASNHQGQPVCLPEQQRERCRGGEQRAEDEATQPQHQEAKQHLAHLLPRRSPRWRGFGQSLGRGGPRVGGGLPQEYRGLPWCGRGVGGRRASV
jgi:putative solute:sodium symporter small subunit